MAGVGERGDPGGGGEQERPEDLGRDLALVVLELQVSLQVVGGEAMDLSCGRGYDGAGAWLPPVMTRCSKVILRRGLASIYLNPSGCRPNLELLKLDLLVLDELGYVPASKAGAELLFDVINTA